MSDNIDNLSREELVALARKMAGGLQSALYLCGTPIGRRRLGIEPDNEHLEEARVALTDFEAAKVSAPKIG